MLQIVIGSMEKVVAVPCIIKQKSHVTHTSGKILGYFLVSISEKESFPGFYVII